MKNRNKIILIGLIIIIIGAIIGLVIVKIVDKKGEGGVATPEQEPGVYYPTEEEINSFVYRVRALIDSVNYVNSVFASTNYDENNSFQNEKTGLTCKKYIGEDSDMIYNVLETIYENPFNDDSYFQKREISGREELFVCLPTSCSVSNDIYAFEITDDAKDEEKKIKVLDKEYTLRLHDGIWKFDDILVNCTKVETAE